MEVSICNLLGETLIKIENIDNKELYFTSTAGKKWEMYHDQDCCEDVSIEEIVGDLDDLLNSPILLAEEVSNADMPEGTINSY